MKASEKHLHLPKFHHLAPRPLKQEPRNQHKTQHEPRIELPGLREYPAQ